MAVLSYLISFVAEITQPDRPKAGGLAGALAASWLLVVCNCNNNDNNNGHRHHRHSY